MDFEPIGAEVDMNDPLTTPGYKVWELNSDVLAALAGAARAQGTNIQTFLQAFEKGILAVQLTGENSARILADPNSTRSQIELGISRAASHYGFLASLPQGAYWVYEHGLAVVTKGVEGTLTDLVNYSELFGQLVIALAIALALDMVKE